MHIFFRLISLSCGNLLPVICQLFDVFDSIQMWEEYSSNGTLGIRKTGRENSVPPHEMEIVRGSAYGIFSRKFVEFVVNDERANDLLEWSQYTYSPDEHYWATLHHTLYNPHLHTPGGYSGCLANCERYFVIFVFASGGILLCIFVYFVLSMPIKKKRQID